MTDAPEPLKPEAAKRSRFRRWLLPASLVVNLLLAGIIAGGALSGRHDDGPPHRKFGFGPLEQAVPAAARQKLEPVFERERANMRTAFRALRGAQGRMHEAMLQQPYDPAAAARAMEAVRDRSVAMQDVLHSLMLSINEKLSLEERRQFLEAMERPLRRSRSGSEH